MLFAKLWKDECGAIVTAEIMLIASILVLGAIVGLAALRDSIVTELADLAQAIANIDQSFSFSGTSGHHAFTGGGFFHDRADFCDNRFNGGHVKNSKCVEICSTPANPICGGNGEGGGGFGGYGGYGG